MTLHLVCDTSGSMSENAKPFIVRTCVLTVAQYLRLGHASTEVTLHSWADTLEEAVDWTVRDEFPQSFHRGAGDASARALDRLALSADDRVLMLTDGLWSLQEGREISNWRRALPEGCLRTIVVGSDAHLPAADLDVFPPDEMLAALCGWLRGSGTMTGWRSFGASVRGPGHVSSGLPNQDAWSRTLRSWGEVVVVSDGVGSRPQGRDRCPRRLPGRPTGGPARSR